MPTKRRFVTELQEYGFAITVMDGKSSVARIGVSDVGMPGVMMIRRIDVVPGARRQRVGTKLYERAAQTACKEYGRPLASDTDRSPSADGFWKKQAAKGRASRVESKYGDYYVLSCPAPRSLAGARRRRR